MSYWKKGERGKCITCTNLTVKTMCPACVKLRGLLTSLHEDRKNHEPYRRNPRD